MLAILTITLTKEINIKYQNLYFFFTKKYIETKSRVIIRSPISGLKLKTFPIVSALSKSPFIVAPII